jgi:hypothetical protein
MRRFLIASGVVGLLAVPAAAQHRHAPAHGTMLEDALPSYAAASQRSRPSFNHRRRMERAGYKKVSSLVNFPSFFPGIGVLYVKPDTLPAGPFLAYDRKDRLVSTIYMIPVDDINNHKKFDLRGLREKADHVTLYFNAGHAGVEMPHYHVVVWHVDKKGEARVAK